MKKIYKLLFCLSIVLFILCMGIFSFYNYVINNWGFIHSQEAQHTLDECVEVLVDTHPLCRNGLPKSTKNIYERLTKEYQKSMLVSRYKEALNLRELVRSLGDGHTVIMPQGSLSQFTKLFDNKVAQDLSFEYQSGKIYVTIQGEEYPLVKINGHNTQEILQNLKIYNEHENLYSTKKIVEYMNGLETLVLSNLARSTDKSISIQYSDDKKIKKESFYFSVNSKKNIKNWYYHIYEEDQYAILTINQCIISSEFIEFLTEFFQKINLYNIKYIAIDLRSNSGGNDICYPIISYLGVSQYITAQNLPEKPSGRVTKQIVKLSPNPNAFNGEVYVLTSKRTYSSAKLLAVTLSINGFAQIIGEPSSNSPSSYGDCTIKYISGENYLLQVSQSYIYLPVDGNTMDIDIPCDPDEAINIFKQKIRS